MDEPLQPIFKLLELTNQLIAQVKDLQDLIAGQQTLICQLQKDIEALSQHKLSLHQVFVFKPPQSLTPNSLPAQNKNVAFWLPKIFDPTIEGAGN